MLLSGKFHKPKVKLYFIIRLHCLYKKIVEIFLLFLQAKLYFIKNDFSLELINYQKI